MNDSDRRRYEMLVRVNQFGTDNAADFPGPSVATDQFSKLGNFVDDAEIQSADQQSGLSEAASAVEQKATHREDLREAMAAISRTARSMEYAFDGISDQFRFRRNLADADLLVKARSIAADAVAHSADFIAYGMQATFIADLTAIADDFEASFASNASATADHVEATALVSESIRQGMVCVRILDGVVKNRYADNPGKLAAWASASHVEKAPKKAAPTPPTP